MHYSSTSVLTWMKKEGVRSEVALAAAVFYVYQAIEYDFSAGAQEHLAGVENIRAEWEHLPELDLAPKDVLRLCSPEWRLTTDAAFCAYIQQVKAVIRGVLGREKQGEEGALCTT
jgi:hypothetical protein